MKNSTLQILKTRSHKLTDIKPKEEFLTNKISPTNYIVHDFNNLYRTSYDDMVNKV